MRALISLMACVLIQCSLFTGCDQISLPGSDDDGESVTFSTVVFEKGDGESETSTEKYTSDDDDASIVDSGLTVMEVNDQNLGQVYAKYGIKTTGLVILESKNSDGLTFGDKITHINETEVTSEDEMNSVLKSFAVGDIITITVTRSGETISVQLTLEEKIPDSVSFE